MATENHSRRSPIDLENDLNRRVSQIRAIVSLGNTESEDPELPSGTMQNAAWAARDLLDDVNRIAAQLRAMVDEREACHG